MLAIVQNRESLDDPASTLRLVEQCVPSEIEVMSALIEVLYSPVHPSNINIIEGTYMYKPSFPFVGGTEACGRVKQIGEDVTELEIDDLVMWKFACDTYGKWTSHMTIETSKLLKLPKEIDPVQASMLMVNPLTSWGLMDPQWTGIDLKRGDWVIQNAGNSSVGQCVIQVCKSLGYRSISLVRRRELFEDLKKLGADAVLLDDRASVSAVKSVTGGSGIRLALNCVGGESASRLLQCLDESSAMVTFGAMGKRNFATPNTDLIFRDIRSLGFHLQFYYKRVGDEKLSYALERLADMVLKKELVQSVDVILPMKKAMEAVERARQSKRKGKVILKCSGDDASSPRTKVDIVVSGLGMRAPDCHTTREFQERLFAGDDFLKEPKRYNAQNPMYDSCVPLKTGEMPLVDRFDSSFFHISKSLANSMMPHTRLALEVAVEAIHNAGLSLEKMKGSLTGVFAANCTGGYEMGLMVTRAELSGREIFAGQSMIPNQVSHALDLRGPSEVVDTACSSTLVAVDRAYSEICRGQCDRAIVIGVQINHNPRKMLAFSKYKMTSRTGECRCLDVGRNGYALSEGCGAILIERKDLIERDQRPYYANLLGTATNSDGYTPQNITYPSTKAQAAVMREALFQAKVNPDDVEFVEAHLTGTKIGDIVECKSLDSVFGRTSDNPLIVGSVKSCVGHLEGASGMMSTLKLMLCYSFGEIAPNCHFTKSDISQVIAGKIKLVTEKREWARGHGMTFNFGFGGTNAAVIFSAGNRRQTLESVPVVDREPFILGLCNHDDPQPILDAQPCQKFFAKLLPDQDRFNYKFFYNVEKNEVDFAEQSEAKPLVMAYGGQGSQEKDMGKWFFENRRDQSPPPPALICPTRKREGQVLTSAIQEVIINEFITTIQRCGKYLDVDLEAEYKCGDNWSDKIMSQLGITSYQVAMTNVLKNIFGFVPDHVTYHSAGVGGALYGAGLVNEEQAMKFAQARVHSVQHALYPLCPFGFNGGMLVVRANANQTQAIIDAAGVIDVDIACLNHPLQTVMSGKLSELQKLKNPLRSAGVKFTLLNTDGVAHHAGWMRPHHDVVDKSVRSLVTIEPQALGKLVPSHPVKNDSEISSILASGIVNKCDWMGAIERCQKLAPGAHFVEISGKPVLSGMIAKMGCPVTAFTTSLRGSTCKSPLARMYDSISSMWLQGGVCPTKYMEFSEGYEYSYQPNLFDHEKIWPLLGEKDWCEGNTNSAEIVDLEKQFSFLRDHTPDGIQILPIAFIAEIAWRKTLDGDAGVLEFEMVKPTLLEHERKLSVEVLKTSRLFEVLVTGKSGKPVIVAEGSYRKEQFKSSNLEIMDQIPGEPEELDVIDRVHVDNRLGSKGYDYGKRFRSIDHIIMMRKAEEGCKSKTYAYAAKLINTESSWLQRIDAALLLPILTRNLRDFTLPVKLEIAFNHWKAPEKGSKWMTVKPGGFGSTPDFEIRHAELKSAQRSNKGKENVKSFYENTEFHRLGDIAKCDTATQGRAFARDIFLDNCRNRVGFIKGGKVAMLVVGNSSSWIDNLTDELGRYVTRSDVMSPDGIDYSQHNTLIVYNAGTAGGDLSALSRVLKPQEGFLMLATATNLGAVPEKIEGCVLIKGYISAEETLTIWRRTGGNCTSGVSVRRPLSFEHWEKLKTSSPSDFILVNSERGQGVVGFNRGFQFEDQDNYGLLSTYLESDECYNATASAEALNEVLRFGLRNTFLSPENVPGIYLGSSTSLQKTSKTFIVERGDVHVILGGTGDLGLCLAEELVSKGCIVVLASRSGLKNGYAVHIAESLGGSCLVEKVDLTSESSIVSLFQRLVDRFGKARVNGVWHWAAAFSSGMVKSLTPSAMDREMAVKVNAVRILDEIEGSVVQSFKHFVVASSVSAQLGGMGMANYCAANQGIEELVRDRVRRGRVGKAMQFGFIKYAGWSAVNTDQASGVNVTKRGSRYSGLDDLPISEAYKYLIDFMGSKATVASCYALSTVKINSDKARSKTQGASKAGSIWEVIATDILALDLKTERIKPTYTMSQLGLDSLRREELRTFLEQRKVQLEEGQALESLTVSQITAFA